MKKTFTLLAIVCSTFQVFGQYARSIYSDDTQPKRHNSLFSINGETTIVSLRESSNDTLRVMLIDIDESGETDNYRMYEYSPFDVSPVFALSGVGTSSSGELTLCILNHSTVNNSMDVKHITIDPASGAFSNPSSTSGVYRRAFSRSRVNGDSLITYFANFSSSGISRVARSLSNSGTSTELVIANGSFSGSLFQNRVACELIVDGSNEYIGTSDRILKRSSAGNYIDSSYAGILNSPCMAINSFGELFALNNYNGEYSVLDASLITFNSGSIPDLQGSPSNLTELYALPNGEIRIWTDRSNTQSVMDLTSSYSVINKKLTRNLPHDQFILAGKQYVIGYEQSHASLVNTDGLLFQNDATNITVVFDDLSDVSDFIEFDQLLMTDKIQFHTNHVSRSFANNTSTSAGFAFEQNELFRTLIYTSSSNILGTDINGSQLGTTSTYWPTPTTGPYTEPGSYDLKILDKYNRGYYVTREMIEMHLFEITTGNPSYVIPFGIQEWPAHGDVALGQAANLASFFDQNGNGTYEPELGDYPSIYGDQCLLNVYHQNPGTPNSASIETHQYYFTFDCDSSEAIENTVFVRTDNFARSQALFDTYEVDYVDFDIGGSSDDYVGTNIELGMIYGYNGDQNDETSNGSLGFQDTIPAIGLITLQGLKLDNDGIDNTTTVPGAPSSNGIGFADGTPDNEYYTLETSFVYAQSGAPNSLTQWYAIAQGLDQNSFPKTVNGVDVRHDYFGTSDANFYSSYGIDHGNNHSEGGLANTAGDRRMTSASGPSTFLTTDTMVLLKAYVVGVDTVNLSPDSSLVRLFENGQELRDLYTQNATFCGNTFDNYVSPSTLAVEEEKIEQIFIYPNPATQHIQFRGIVGQANLNILDLNGRLVLSDQDIDDNRSIDISFLDTAVYLIQISNESGTQTIRMIKK
ncbi:MAG: T9SS type A sorting domain-containing protein [Crocinitomicaceae bacterium]|nr:T9SS type A sorting domain-containing protein [Crocinitomicaceae bacterium]